MIRFSTRLLLCAVLVAALAVAARGAEASGEAATPGSPPTADNSAPSTDVKSILPGEPQYYDARAALYDASGNVSRAVELLQESADLGYAGSQSLLAVLHAYGIGVPRSEAKAVLYHSFAAMNGNIESHVALAHRYTHGLGVPAMYCEAMKHAKFAADTVARGYTSQVHAKVDMEKLGDARAAAHSNDAKMNLDVQILRADQGNAQSAMMVGYAYMLGLHGARQNGHLAVEYFDKARKLGENAAYGALGQIYSQGIVSDTNPVPKDLDKAMKLFQKGAEAGHATSLNGLGYMHATGALAKDGTHQWKEAEQLFARSAKSGNAEGLYNLGILYLNGRGVAKSHTRARELLDNAAMLGSVLAKYQLGNLDAITDKTRHGCRRALRQFAAVNERGRWLDRAHSARAAFDAGNYGAALIDYLILSELGVSVGDHNAAHILRLEYDHNIPVLDSASTAAAADAEVGDDVHDAHDAVLHALLWRSAKQGNHDAQLQLGDNYLYGRGTMSNERKAAEQYLLAAQAGSAQAMYNVGFMYETGSLHSSQDFFLAKRYYDSALEANPASYVAVRIALYRLNFRWWLKHFITAPATVTPAADEKATAPSAATPEASDAAKTTAPSKPARAAQGETSLYRLACAISDSLTPTVFGFALDTLVLLVAGVVGCLILLLRHNAF